MAQANVTLTVDASGATRALQGVQTKTNALQRSFGGLKAAIGGIGVTLLARQAIRTSANFDKLNVRLGLLTKSSGTFARSQEIAANAQKAFGLSATEALEGITDITARLQPLGVGVEDIKSTFFGFNTAAKLAGASTIEASNAFRQLAQALGSGRLQGDEFRSISEQIPTLLAPVADELNTTVGELKKFASEGKLTSDVVLRALRKIETEGAGSLKALIANDPTQVFKNLSNATEDLARAFGEKFNPVVLPAIKALTNLTTAAGNFINTPLAKTIGIFTGLALAVKSLGTAITLLTAAQTILIAKFKATTVGAIAFAKASSTASVVTKALAFSTGALTIALNALPLIGIATAFGLVTTAIIKNIDKQKKLNALVKQGGEEEVKAAIKTLEARAAVLELQKRGGNLRREALENIRKQIEELEKRLGTLKKEKDAIEETTDATGKLSEAFKQVGDNIATGVSDALTDAILQTKSLADAARGLLQGIARDLLRLGINTFLSSTFGGIFSSLPTFAAGGRPPVGRPSIVGERGPELFVPSTAGTIIPNDKMGGVTNNIVVNVDVDGGASVDADENNSKQFGLALAAAIQSEIINQKRAGGLLA